MSKVKQQDIDRLIVLVGGRDNIATVSHCITRLRFVLNDPAKASPKEIETLPMVKGCFTNAGQFQVVIGPEVGDYYQALIATTGVNEADKEQAKVAARQNMTVTRAVVQLENGGYGYSYIAGRDKAHAELCALADALLQQPDQTELLQQRLIEPLAALLHEQRQLRARSVASSRVDFFTLVRGD